MPEPARQSIAAACNRSASLLHSVSDNTHSDTQCKQPSTTLRQVVADVHHSWYDDSAASPAVKIIESTDCSDRDGVDEEGYTKYENRKNILKKRKIDQRSPNEIPHSKFSDDQRGPSYSQMLAARSSGQSNVQRMNSKSDAEVKKQGLIGKSTKTDSKFKASRSLQKKHSSTLEMHQAILPRTMSSRTSRK